VSQKTNTHFGTAVVTMAVVVGLIALVLYIVNSVYGGGGSADSDMSAAAIDARLKPVGELNTGAPVVAAAKPATVAAAPVAARSGDAVYNTTCMACHAAGVAGAPKIGDKDAWAGRIAQGMDTMVQHSITGFQGKTGVMPPRGTCGACSDDELRAAVEYMVSQVE